MSTTLASDAVKPWRRLAASIIDLSLLLPIHYLLLILMPKQTALLTLILIGLASAVISWRWFGATPGMTLMDCTLIESSSGKKPTWFPLIKRIIGLLLALLPFGIGLLWILKGPDHQGWQDKISGTAIIKDDEGRKSLAQLEEEVR